MHYKFGSLFSGIGTVEAGLRDNFTPIFACESDDLTRNVYQYLHPYSSVSCNLFNVNYLPKLDWLHLSPPCQNFSTNKSGKCETTHDRDKADRFVSIIRDTVIKPRFITLENVISYKKSQSFATIDSFLQSIGYSVQVCKLDSYDFAAPQRRRRLWVLYSLDGFIFDPHQPFMKRGWFKPEMLDSCKAEAVLPSSTQLRLLPENLPDIGLIPRVSIGRSKINPILPDQPIPTFTRGMGSCTVPFNILYNGKFFDCLPEHLYYWLGFNDYWSDLLTTVVSQKVCTQRQLNQMLGNGVSPPIVSEISRQWSIWQGSR